MTEESPFGRTPSKGVQQPVGFEPPVGFGRFGQPVRIMLYGNPELANKHVGIAKAILGDLYNRDVRLGGNQIATVERKLPNGVIIRARWDTAMPRIDIYADAVEEEEKDEDSILVIWPIKHIVTFYITDGDRACYSPVPSGLWYPRQISHIAPMVTKGITSFNAIYTKDVDLARQMVFSDELIDNLEWFGGRLGERERWLLPDTGFPAERFQAPRIQNYAVYPVTGSNNCTTTTNVTVYLVGLSTPSESGDKGLYANFRFRDGEPTPWEVTDDGDLLVTVRYGRSASWGMYDYTAVSPATGRFMLSNAMHPEPFATFTYTYHLDDFPEKITYDDCNDYADILNTASGEELRTVFNKGDVYKRKRFFGVTTGKPRPDDLVLDDWDLLYGLSDLICVEYVLQNAEGTVNDNPN